MTSVWTNTRKVIITSITRINKFSLNAFAVILCRKEMRWIRRLSDEVATLDWLRCVITSESRRISCRVSAIVGSSIKRVFGQFIFLKWVSLGQPRCYLLNFANSMCQIAIWHFNTQERSHSTAHNLSLDEQEFPSLSTYFSIHSSNTKRSQLLS